MTCATPGCGSPAYAHPRDHDGLCNEDCRHPCTDCDCKAFIGQPIVGGPEGRFDLTRKEAT